MTTFNELPTHLQYKIIRLLDIDTRRVLNIYSKINIIPSLNNKLLNLQKIRNIYNDLENHYILSIYPYVIKHTVTKLSSTSNWSYCIYNSEAIECYYYGDNMIIENLPRLLYDE